MIEKRILVRHRVRRPPATGWSWVDRRFLRDHAERLSSEATLLYFFLAAVGDRHGLSFYSDATIGLILRLRLDIVASARDELLEHDLIAHEAPLTQVLSLPSRALARPTIPGQGLWHVGDLFRQIAVQQPQSLQSECSRRSP